jgi:hypothetical protein
MSISGSKRFIIGRKKLTILNLSDLKTFANDANIKSPLKFLVIRYATKFIEAVISGY